jgi:hypothetical protein
LRSSQIKDEGNREEEVEVEKETVGRNAEGVGIEESERCCSIYVAPVPQLGAIGNRKRI